MPISIWTIIAVRERTMLTCLSVYQIPFGFRDHHRTSLGHLWAFCGYQITLKLTAGYATTSRPLVPIYGLLVPYLWLSVFTFHLSVFTFHFSVFQCVYILLCEMKYTQQPYALDKTEAEKITNRMAPLQTFNRKRHNVQCVLVTK